MHGIYISGVVAGGVVATQPIAGKQAKQRLPNNSRLQLAWLLTFRGLLAAK